MPVAAMNADAIDSSAIEVQRCCKTNYPSDTQIIAWVNAVLEFQQIAAMGITIRVVEASEIQECNLQWRNKDKATNVLSFPAELPEELGMPYLGDIMICAEVLQTESQQQGKSLSDHWAHILTHGVLHLLGYDHEHNTEAGLMEQREIEILATLGITDPYREEYNP